MSESADPEFRPATVRVDFPRDDQAVPVVYANNVGVTFSPHDMTMHFSWFAVPPTGPESLEGAEVEAIVRLVSKVSIPLTAARALAQILTAQAEAWEATFGREIPDLHNRIEEREAEEARSNE